MQSMIPALTERQRFWLKHIQACEASGKSIAAYSAEQGIVAQAMYGGPLCQDSCRAHFVSNQNSRRRQVSKKCRSTVKDLNSERCR